MQPYTPYATHQGPFQTQYQHTLDRLMDNSGPMVNFEAPAVKTSHINHAWTHPNPYVYQIGNHLYHKDEIPKHLKYNYQRRDKEVLDNLKNRLLRQKCMDPTPSLNRQLVQRPPSVPARLGVLPTSRADGSVMAMEPAHVPLCEGDVGGLAGGYGAPVGYAGYGGHVGPAYAQHPGLQAHAGFAPQQLTAPLGVPAPQYGGATVMMQQYA
eukprot:NODE_1807_length_836_cov_1136.322745_g1426_i0.p1 GENE.NODE_1807_length_836_cov_1136.322745_g1426_i0~~NODE_1807_length_836_cov_1136.322745_g1426_i0.p1  ORF type:complete len:210 (+),score=43.25 NODE_1807_length_836_cov_1136.322745_g1426_i0:69-698(+)